MWASVPLHAPTALILVKTSQYPLSRRVDGSQSRSGLSGDEKNHFLLPEIESRLLKPLACTIPTTLLQLEYIYKVA